MNIPLCYTKFPIMADHLPTRFIVVYYEAEGVFQCMILADGFAQTFSHSAASKPATFDADYPHAIQVNQALI